jgi:accessory colonization factor AcfC
MVENKHNKHLARKAYGERQIDKWVTWSYKNKGRVLWKELVEQQNNYNIKCYE